MYTIMFFRSYCKCGNQIGFYELSCQSCIMKNTENQKQFEKELLQLLTTYFTNEANVAPTLSNLCIRVGIYPKDLETEITQIQQRIHK